MRSIDEKLDSIAADVSDIRTTQAVQTEQLKEHMRRTELAEESIVLVRAEMKPLTRAHAMWSGVGKALAILGTLIAILGGLLKALR